MTDYRIPRELIYVTTDRDPLGRLIGRIRTVPLPHPEPVEIERDRPSPQPEKIIPQEGIVPIDGNDADGDGYVEYYNNGHYVAELRKSPVEDNKPQQLMFRGRVQAQEVIAIRDRKLPHLLLRLQAADGKSALVDLGVAQQFQDVEFQTGEELSVVARLGKINDQPILIADQVDIGNTTLRTVR